MSRLARAVLRFTYFYARLIGMLPFVYDFRQHRIYKTCYASDYTVLAHLLILVVLPTFIAINIARHASADQLHQIVAIVVMIVRYCTLLVSFSSSWRHSMKVIGLFNDWHFLWHQHFRQLYMSDIALQRTHARWIMLKFSSTLLADVLTSALFIHRMWNYGDALILASAMIALWISSLLNMVMWQYYNAVLVIEMHFRTLVSNFQTLVLDTKHSSVDQFKLAAELHVLLVMYYRVHRLIDSINKMHVAHGCGILFTLYINNIAVGYVIYAYFRYESRVLADSSTSWLLLILAIVAYYCDLLLFMRTTFSALALGVKCQKILEQALTLPSLDFRVFKELTIFKLQHAAYPIELNLSGIFKFRRSLAFSFLASATLNAIVLIQYDYQHSA